MKVIFFLVCLLPGISFGATVYKCVDGRGRVTFAGHPCAVDAQKVTIKVPDLIGTNMEPNAYLQGQVNGTIKQQAYERKLAAARDKLATLKNALASKLADLDVKASYANNNLAGAVYGDSVAKEKQAATAQYTPLIAQQQKVLDGLVANPPK